MSFYLKEPNSNKATIIYLIYDINNSPERFKYSTSQKIIPSNWNFESRTPIARRGAGGVESKHLTTVLSNYTNFLRENIRESEENSTLLTKKYLTERFDEKFKHKKSIKRLTNISDVIALFIESKNKSKGKSITWNNKYNNLKNKIELFGIYNGTRYKFGDICQDWLEEFGGFLRSLNIDDFDYYLIQHFGKKAINQFGPLNDNSLHRFIKFFFTFLRWSEGDYHSLKVDRLANPANDYESDGVFHTKKEVEILEKIELSEDLDKIRDVYLIGVYSGQRFSDYSVFERSDLVGKMIIKKSKKMKTESFIPIHSRLMNLLNKYDWKPPKMSSQKFNPKIQEVCRMAGFDEETKETIYRGDEVIVNYNPKYKMVGSHTARRTFITLSAESGMPDHIIMKITGIKDEKTLRKYKKTSQKSVEEFMFKHWD